MLSSVVPSAAVAAPDSYLLTTSTANPVGALVPFDTVNPTGADLNAGVPISGTGGERILGIDVRPADGRLYGVSEVSRLYAIDPATGSAAQVGAPGAVGLDPFTGVFQGVGFAFDPVSDLLRVVEDDGLVNGQDDNFVVNPLTGVFTQQSDLGGGATDVDISGLAYTNPFAGAGQTTLYGIETNQPVGGNARLVVIDPPAAGTLTNVDANANGLGVAVGGQEMGFDIDRNTGRASATLLVGGIYSLYQVLLGVADGGNGSGDALLVGPVASGAAQATIPGFRVRGFAMAPPPAPAGPPASPPAAPPAADTTRPNTRIGAGPKRRTRARKATFRFSSTEPGSRFQCKLDKKPWKSCRSPKTYRRLRLGPHVFRVRAFDLASNMDASPAVKRWRIVRTRRPS
jgi:hypothetical protein